MLGSGKTTAMGIGLYFTALLAIYGCFKCQDCNKVECIVQALIGVIGGTGLVLAKDKDATGGTIPVTVEAQKRTEGPGAVPLA